MNGKRNAHSAVGAAERAVMGTDFAGQNSLSNLSTHLEARPELFISSLLLHGEENAIPTAHLVQLAGVKSARELQNKIASERGKGALILSSCRNGGGYFLPAEGEAGREEIKAFIRTLKARALNTIRALKTAMAEIGEMMVLEDIYPHGQLDRSDLQ